MKILDQISRVLNRLFVFIGGLFLVAMVVLTCGNILLRLSWLPIRGTFELMGFFGAVVTALALGYTQITKGHISVDILINTFSQKTRKVLNTINFFLCAIFFGVAAWQMVLKAMTLKETKEVTETLRIIYYPFTYAVAIGLFFLALVLLVDFLKQFSGKGERTN